MATDELSAVGAATKPVFSSARAEYWEKRMRFLEDSAGLLSHRSSPFLTGFFFGFFGDSSFPKNKGIQPVMNSEKR
ncbi:MAG: hypothetical protein Q8K67_06720 [Geothrix sp.]|nr:hypothetical protein [Geothrix sp.]